MPVSAVCQRALEQAVRRVTAIRETALDDLDELDLAGKLGHFTPRTRAAIKLGIEQARAAGDTTVGTGYLLSGVLAEGTNLALHVLRAMEIEPKKVRDELDRRSLAEPGGPADNQSRRFSGPAAAALELTVAEATAFGHNYVGTEHLLLGLVAESDGVAGRILRALGAELRLTRRAVAAALAGFVHLQVKTSPGASAGAGQADQAAAFTTLLRQELQPLVQRIERLEERVGVSGDS